MTIFSRYLAGLLVLTACGGQRAPSPAQHAAAATTRDVAAVPAKAVPTHVDSAIPRDLALARFQRASAPVTKLSGAAASRDDLVRRFTRAVESGDTVALRRLTLSRAEFAYLYYPTSAQGLPPYGLSPDLMWFMQVERSDRGVNALLTERAGKPLGAAGYRCLGDSTVEGKNRLWGPCVIRRVIAPGDTVEERLFGPIVERDGRFKFVGYSNRL
jgi:hypothetical protein